MKIKQRPEDFSVKESWRFDTVEEGKYRVYLMDKQKLSTFDAVERIRERFGLRPGLISYCGLKDKQGRTEQLVAVEGKDVDLQDPDLRLKYLGRTDRALSAANTTSNRFSVTVRELTQEDISHLPVTSAEVNRLGVVNYFDSQRFGSLKHGQGFIAKDLIRGDYEAALRNYMAQPSPLDRTSDAKVKAFWKANWGRWNRNPEVSGNAKYYRILRSLREDPKDFLKAFLQIESNYRALLLFTYQSYLWNEGVRRLLAQMLPREHLFPMPYQAGTLLFHTDADPAVLKILRKLTFPLLAPNTTFTDPNVEKAVAWVLGKEKLKLSDLSIKGAERMLYFKHEERPVVVFPQKLVLGRPMRDELNRGAMKLNIAFTLPPGSYATLVVKRLLHFSWLGEEKYEPREIELPPVEVPEEGPQRPSRSPPERVPSGAGSRVSSRPGAPRPARVDGASDRLSRLTARGARRPEPEPQDRDFDAPAETVESPSAAAEEAAESGPAPGPKGFLAQQKARKVARQQAREQARKDPKQQKKPAKKPAKKRS